MKNENIYTRLCDIENEIKKRRDDIELKDKLENFWGENKPNFIKADTRLVISKPLITPNIEFKYFIDLAREFDREVSLFEYLNGKFVGINDEKKHLGKMYFYHGKGKKHGNIINKINILDFSSQEGKTLKDVALSNGKKIKDFHREMLENKFPNTQLDIQDISEWFDKTKNIDEYYVFYLSLFLRDFVLFENFIFDDKEESKFTLKRFMPSFEKVEKIFGYKPLIVPLLPHEEEKSKTWFYYDGDVEEYVRRVI